MEIRERGGPCGGSANPSTLSPSCASSWPFLALPPAEETPRGIGELHSGVLSEAAVDGAFLGLDGIRDVALTKTAALKERLRESKAIARATKA
jgi:hypothetical protein